jgi:hypothetical protein
MLDANQEMVEAVVHETFGRQSLPVAPVASVLEVVMDPNLRIERDSPPTPLHREADAHLVLIRVSSQPFVERRRRGAPQRHVASLDAIDIAVSRRVLGVIADRAPEPLEPADRAHRAGGLAETVSKDMISSSEGSEAELIAKASLNAGDPVGKGLRIVVREAHDVAGGTREARVQCRHLTGARDENDRERGRVRRALARDGPA